MGIIVFRKGLLLLNTISKINIAAITNFVALSWSVFKSLEVIVKNQFPYGESKWEFLLPDLNKCGVSAC